MRNAAEAARAVPLPVGIQNIPQDQPLTYLGKLVWQLYDANKDLPVFTFKKWFISFTVTVEQIRPLLEKWFGPHP